MITLTATKALTYTHYLFSVKDLLKDCVKRDEFSSFIAWRTIYVYSKMLAIL